MAPFASYASWDQAVAFHGRFNRVMNAFENHINQLPGTCLLTFHPTDCTRSNVAIHAFNSRVGRVLMGGEFRFHDVATLSAELWRFHILNSAICALGPNHDVGGGGHRKENRKLPNVGSPVAGSKQSCSARTDAPPGKEDPESDQHETQDEDNRDHKKDDDADVGIAGVPSKLGWQSKQPREASGGYQRDAQHADPMTGEQHEYRTFWIVVHSLYSLPSGFRLVLFMPTSISSHRADLSAALAAPS